MALWTNLLPLALLFIILGVVAFIGMSMYQWSNELATRANAKMEKKNMSFSKEGGLRVGVKELKDENYADKTQSVLVNVWNNAALPNYKSRLGWNSTQGGVGGASSAATASGQVQQRAGRSSGQAAQLKPGSSNVRRSASPVPGSWS